MIEVVFSESSAVLTNKRWMSRRALLAIAFAGGMLGHPMPARSEAEVEAKSSDSGIEQIAGNSQLKPEFRAYLLLLIASSYLNGNSQEAVEKQFKYMADETSSSRQFRRAEGWELLLVGFANRVSEYRLFKRGTIERKLTAKVQLQPVSHELSVLAAASIQRALTEIEQVSDPFAKLNLYYIVSRLFEESGNADGMRKYDEIVDQAIQSCEGSSSVEQTQIKAVSSILNSMAYGVIPVSISDYKPRLNEQSLVPVFTEKDFNESERLKLRANAMVDRLDSRNHLRRKAHRDLSLWYTKLGKEQMGEKEAQVLFELIGLKDHGLLYPAIGGCGRVIWWRILTTVSPSYCGMG